ncbi:MAG TPA: glutamate-5-semialdehyde dehydrogenase, partial [Archangium sp.]
MKALAQASRVAARTLVSATTAQKNEALHAMAAALRAASAEIRAQNALDLEDAQKSGKNAAFIDRLLLDEKRVEAMAAAVEQVAALPDPVGEVTERWTRPNGLRVRKERLPLGVVLMIYESRPNVTSDAAALCLKSGNAAILRGGSESFRSNQAIAKALQAGVTKAGLPVAAVQLVPSTDRESMLELIRLEGLVDLCIPRGGEGLIRFVVENARVPVVKHYQGVCHVFVEASGDLAKAEQ